MSVRTFVAALLLACFGIILPTAAAPARVCLLERRLAVSHPEAADDCCSDCQEKSRNSDPCCLDLKQLPDSQAPQPVFELPPLPAVELPAPLLPPALVVIKDLKSDPRETPIRGPTSPAAWRAVIGVWRL